MKDPGQNAEERVAKSRGCCISGLRGSSYDRSGSVAKARREGNEIDSACRDLEAPRADRGRCCLGPVAPRRAPLATFPVPTIRDSRRLVRQARLISAAHDSPGTPA